MILSKEWRNKYRFTDGWRGWLVMRLDARWLRRVITVADRINGGKS